MTSNREPFRDPVVEEVRAIRKQLWEAAGNSVARFLEQLDREIPRDRPPRPPAPSPAPPGRDQS